MNHTQDRFVRWNQRLLESFFSPANRGGETWLQVNPAELDSIGPDLGGDEMFLLAVREGAPWPTVGGSYSRGTSADLVERAMGLVRQRRVPASRPLDYCDPGQLSGTYRERNAPTYLPFLAALVRSAAIAPDGFYSHIHAAVSLPPSWGSERMKALRDVWADLQKWTEEVGGIFGQFVCREVGGYRQIALPRSQSIMSSRDCSLISRVFVREGLRPGQGLKPSHITGIKQSARDSFYLSAAFKDAISKPELDEPVSSRLISIFGDWDGSVQALSNSSGGSDTSDENDVHVQADVEVCLSQQSGSPSSWLIHWRVPALVDSGDLILERERTVWNALMRGAERETTSSDASDVIQDAARSILASSGSHDVQFDVTVRVEDADEASRVLMLRKQDLRVLRWVRNATIGRNELQERPLPLDGAAYLLASKENSRRLSDYLSRESVVHKRIFTTGLPIDWNLVCIPNCEGLSPEQRDTIPDGRSKDDRAASPILRLIGGRSVRRAGIRQYLAYDLPLLELDAKQGARPTAEGLTFTEDASDENAEGSIRRFRISTDDKMRRVFNIEAKFQRNLLGSVPLRIASAVGENVAHGKAFSIDNNGDPQATDDGLRGLLSDAMLGNISRTASPQIFKIERRSLGSRVKNCDVEHLKKCSAAKFLDSIAQAGSLEYGAARDQLSRLLAEEGLPNVSPAVLMLNLRSRAHIELETNHKGHLVRVHAVQPTLYELPLSAEGGMVVGVLGSLRLRHWDMLGGEDLGTWESYALDSTGGTLPAWRIVVDDEDALDALKSLNVGAWCEPQSAAIAQWSAGKDDVTALAQRWGRESIGSSPKEVQRFNSSKALFFGVENICWDARVRNMLFRLKDSEMVGDHRLYVLGMADPEGRPRYGFLRDSRWGVWIGLSAFAQFIAKELSILEASPWPIPYLPTTGSIWIPARMNLPVILERALVLCGGTAPESIDIRGRTEGASLELFRRSDGNRFGSVSCVYEEMANGKWLAYHNVPKVVAELVAARIGAVVTDAFGPKSVDV